MNKKILWTIIIFLVLLLFCGLSVGFGVLAFKAMEGQPAFTTADSVALIRVEGIIQGGDPPADVFGNTTEGAYSNRIVRNLRRAENDSHIKAVVLRVDSPGGGVVASDEIYEQVKAMTKPVVVSMGTLTASGGYYISAPADEIWANRHTLTGSIGVIIQFVNIEGFMEKYGIGATIIKSGANKDAGSLYRQPTAEEIAIWQGIVDEAYGVFVQIVAEGRGLDEETVRKLADGRVYTGQQALDLHLVDRLGNLKDAINRAGELGGIEGEPNVIDFRNPAPLLPGLFNALQKPSPAEELRTILHIDASPSLMYLYTGG